MKNVFNGKTIFFSFSLHFIFVKKNYFWLFCSPTAKTQKLCVNVGTSETEGNDVKKLTLRKTIKARALVGFGTEYEKFLKSKQVRAYSVLFRKKRNPLRRKKKKKIYKYYSKNKKSKETSFQFQILKSVFSESK
jgi:hypothetical protein